MARPLKRNENKSVLQYLIPRLLQGLMKRFKTSMIAFVRAEAAAAEHENFNNRHVRTCCMKGKLKEAMRILHAMDQSVDSSTYAYLLQTCTKKKALSEGKLIDFHMSEAGFKPDICLANMLLTMYTKCGSLADARRVFDQIPEPNVISWTVMIAAYTRLCTQRMCWGGTEALSANAGDK